MSREPSRLGPGGLCPWDWSPLHRERGRRGGGGSYQKSAFFYLNSSLLLLRSKCFSRGCSGADTEFTGKWSVFAERADFGTGQQWCCWALGSPVLAGTLSSHVGAMGDARSRLC